MLGLFKVVYFFVCLFVCFLQNHLNLLFRRDSPELGALHLGPSGDRVVVLSVVDIIPTKKVEISHLRPDVTCH